MGGTPFLTATTAINRPVMKMMCDRWSRRRRGLTKMNGYKLSKRKQPGRLQGVALSLWMTVK